MFIFQILCALRIWWELLNAQSELETRRYINQSAERRAREWENKRKQDQVHPDRTRLMMAVGCPLCLCKPQLCFQPKWRVGSLGASACMSEVRSPERVRIMTVRCDGRLRPLSRLQRTANRQPDFPSEILVEWEAFRHG